MDYNKRSGFISMFQCVLPRCDIRCKCFKRNCNLHDDLRHFLYFYFGLNRLRSCMAHHVKYRCHIELWEAIVYHIGSSSVPYAKGDRKGRVRSKCQIGLGSFLNLDVTRTYLISSHGIVERKDNLTSPEALKHLSYAFRESEQRLSWLLIKYFWVISRFLGNFLSQFDNSTSPTVYLHPQPLGKTRPLLEFGQDCMAALPSVVSVTPAQRGGITEPSSTA
ncbi:Hypothetical protein SMAX5B_016709, partial [Scophthalmus maximus]